jgi:hypothetical protein
MQIVKHTPDVAALSYRTSISSIDKMHMFCYNIHIIWSVGRNARPSRTEVPEMNVDLFGRQFIIENRLVACVIFIVAIALWLAIAAAVVCVIVIFWIFVILAVAAVALLAGAVAGVRCLVR